MERKDESLKAEQDPGTADGKPATEGRELTEAELGTVTGGTLAYNVGNLAVKTQFGDGGGAGKIGFGDGGGAGKTLFGDGGGAGKI